MKLQELLDKKKHVLFCIKDVMVMQKDTADSHSVGLGRPWSILYHPFEEMFHLHKYSCKHTESLYKLMATEQKVLFL